MEFLSQYCTKQSRVKATKELYESLQSLLQLHFHFLPSEVVGRSAVIKYSGAIHNYVIC